MRFAPTKTIVEHAAECPYCHERNTRQYERSAPHETQDSVCRHFAGLYKRDGQILAAFAPKGKK